MQFGKLFLGIWEEKFDVVWCVSDLENDQAIVMRSYTVKLSLGYNIMVPQLYNIG